MWAVTNELDSKRYKCGFRLTRTDSFLFGAAVQGAKLNVGGF